MRSIELEKVYRPYIGWKAIIISQQFNSTKRKEITIVSIQLPKNLEDKYIWLIDENGVGTAVFEETVIEWFSNVVIEKKPKHSYRQSFISAVIEGCSRKSYLDYIKQVYHPVHNSLFVGQIFHKVYETFFSNKIRTNQNLTKIDIAGLTVQFFKEKLKDPQFEGMNMYDSATKQDHTMSSLMTMTQALVNSYYNTACGINDALGTEVLGSMYIESEDTEVTTHLDLQRESGILDWKSARVYNYSQRGPNSGREYFPDWDKGTVKQKAQAKIHLLIFGNQPYAFHVVGKGQTEKVEAFEVVDSNAALEAWKENIIIPTIQQINHGDFPARPNQWCGNCPYLKNSHYCGIGL